MARISLFLFGWALLVRLTGVPLCILPSPQMVLAESARIQRTILAHLEADPPCNTAREAPAA